MLGSKIFLTCEMLWLLLLENTKPEQISSQSDTETLAKAESSQIALSPDCWWLSNSQANTSSIAASLLNSFLPFLHSQLLQPILLNIFFFHLLALLFLDSTFQTRSLVSEREMCCSRWEFSLLIRERWGQKDVKMLGVYSCCFLKATLYHKLSQEVAVVAPQLYVPSTRAVPSILCVTACHLCWNTNSPWTWSADWPPYLLLATGLKRFTCSCYV